MKHDPNLAANGRPIEHKAVDLDELAKRFDEYHTEAKGLSDTIAGLKRDLAAEQKEREALETKLNRGGLGGGGADAQTERKAALKEIGEAFRLYMKTGDKSGFAELEKKGLSVGSDPQGGYTVIPEFSNSITQTLVDISPMRQVANVRTISTDALEEVYDRDEADAEWVGETSSRPETGTPDVGKWRIAPNEIYAMPKASQQILDDSAINIGEWLVGKVSTRFAEKEGNAFVNGNGVSKPRGFLDYGAAAVTTADDTRDWGKLQYVATGAAADFASSNPGDKLVDLQAELKAGYRPNAVWLMNRRTAAKIAKFKDGAGNYLWQRALVAGQPDTLLGHRVVIDEEMPAAGSNTFPVAFGDFKAGYTIVDRLGIRVLQDPYTAKPYVLFYCYARVGGDVTNFEAIKLLKCAAS